MIEQRRHFRRPVEYSIEIEAAGVPRIAGVCRDLSLGGMHVEATELPAFAAEVTVHLTLPGGGAPLAMPAVVRWTKPGNVGLQFGLLGARETYAIMEVVGPPSSR